MTLTSTWTEVYLHEGGPNVTDNVNVIEHTTAIVVEGQFTTMRVKLYLSTLQETEIEVEGLVEVLEQNPGFDDEDRASTEKESDDISIKDNKPASAEKDIVDIITMMASREKESENGDFPSDDK